jgi:hypothetical protein
VVTYKADGFTLTFTGSDGRVVSLTPLDGQAYYNALVVKSAQDQAAIENTASIADYHTKLNNFQGLIDSGRDAGQSAPAVPLQKAVGDDGTVTMTPFDPPLPMPRYPTITPSGSIKSTPAPDRIDVLMNLLMVQNATLTRIATQLGVK